MSGNVIRHVKSNKRPPPLLPADYDHEIYLIDSTRAVSTSRSRSQSGRNSLQTTRELSPVSAARRLAAEQSRKKRPLRDEIAKRRYAKYQAQNEGTADNAPIPEEERSVTPLNQVENTQTGDTNGSSKTLATSQTTTLQVSSEPERRGRPASSKSKRKPRSIRREQDADSHIDILYENERGLFICGHAFFSKAALGAADAKPWTNENHKPSLSDINNHQPPDPSWEWAWDRWHVNHDDTLGDKQQDEDGWEYSFAYSKKNRLSWHGPTWYSYVRRRAWIRKRVRKSSGYLTQNEGHMLNADYFTIHPLQARSHSPATFDASSRTPTNRESKGHSVYTLQRREMEEAITQHDIHDIGLLMRALRFCRIDREKTEIVESFIEHGEDDLFYLKEKMSEIMNAFIFQASRKLLLSQLMENLDATIAAREARTSDEKNRNLQDEDEMESASRRIEYLKEAIKAADEQVKELEFWSDIKAMALAGDIPRAVDEDHGWSPEKWIGLGDSGPRDVISEREEPGYARAVAEKKTANVETVEVPESHTVTGDKGKSRA